MWAKGKKKQDTCIYVKCLIKNTRNRHIENFSHVLVETESLSSHALCMGVQIGDITLKNHLELPLCRCIYRGTKYHIYLVHLQVHLHKYIHCCPFCKNKRL